MSYGFKKPMITRLRCPGHRQEAANAGDDKEVTVLPEEDTRDHPWMKVHQGRKFPPAGNGDRQLELAGAIEGFCFTRREHSGKIRLRVGWSTGLPTSPVPQVFSSS